MVFKLCPHCGGSVVRMKDEAGLAYLSCQKCVWTELAESDLSKPDGTVKVPNWVHLGFVLFVIVLSGLLLSAVLWPKK